MPALGLHHHIAEPAQVIFKSAYLRQAVKRPNDKKCIAQPAIAVIPVALTARRFRNAGRHGGNNGAGVFKQRELERDGSPYHGRLPFEWNMQTLAPFAPIRNGFLFKQASRIGNAIGQGLICAQQKIMFARQDKRLALAQVRDRRISCEPQGEGITHKAQVVAALGDCRVIPAPVKPHVEHDPNTRCASYGFNAPNQCHGPKITRIFEKPWRKVCDFNALAGLVEKLGPQHGRVVLVPLPGFMKIFNLNGKGTWGWLVYIARLQQRIKNRVGIKTRQTAPDDAGAFVNQRTDGAVANHRHV